MAQMPVPVPTSRARYINSAAGIAGRCNETYVDFILLQWSAIELISTGKGHRMVAKPHPSSENQFLNINGNGNGDLKRSYLKSSDSLCASSLDPLG